MLQEIRATPEQLPKPWARPRGWHVYWHPAERKGYSGTAIWSRHPLSEVQTGLEPHDSEGRVILALIQGIRVACVYLPSGSSGAERQQIKEVWLKKMMPWARRLVERDEPVVIGGDLNIAHTEKDIFYAKSNEKNSGFLPHERAWMGDLLGSGWCDFVRRQYGEVQGPYSWWSNRGRARELDRGWRIDYLLGNKCAEKRFKSASIRREGGLTVSDHAPVMIDLAQEVVR